MTPAPYGPKVLFLDIDGVILSYGRIRTSEGRLTRDVPEQHLCDRVNLIIQGTGAALVVSGAMRRHFDDLEGLRIHLEKAGLDTSTFFGATGVPCQWRGDEIQEWLDEHPDVQSFLILDDEGGMLHLDPHLLLVEDRNKGISTEEALEAIRRLR